MTTTTTTTTTEPASTTSTRGLVIGLVLGGPMIVAGIAGALDAADATKPGELARWVVGAAIVHDLLVAPLALALGWVVQRVVRDDAIRRALRAGLLASAALALVAYPFVRGFGRSRALPSALNRDYSAGLAAYLVVVWVVVAAVVVVRLVRRRAAA